MTAVPLPTPVSRRGSARQSSTPTRRGAVVAPAVALLVLTGCSADPVADPSESASPSALPPEAAGLPTAPPATPLDLPTTVDGKPITPDSTLVPTLAPTVPAPTVPAAEAPLSQDSALWRTAEELGEEISARYPVAPKDISSTERGLVTSNGEALSPLPVGVALGSYAPVRQLDGTAPKGAFLLCLTQGGRAVLYNAQAPEPVSELLDGDCTNLPD